MVAILSRPPHGHHGHNPSHHLFPDASWYFMKIFMVAGEASGDIYGGLIAKNFSDQTLTLRGWGGENMQSSGVTITKHYRELAYMGLWEVISHLPTILKNIDTCWNEIQDFKPDALVLIDFPGFNMRIAQKARKAGIKVYQVVVPQVWAWKKGRVKNLARDYTAVFPVLPFEHDLLSTSGVPSIYHGHPIIDTLEKIETNNDLYGIGGPFEESIAYIIKKELSKYLINKDPLATEYIWDLMHRGSVHGRQGNTMIAISAIDNALWDLKGKYFNVPVYSLIGGPTINKVPAYASMLGFNVDDMGLVAERAKLYHSYGYKI